MSRDRGSHRTVYAVFAMAAASVWATGCQHGNGGGPGGNVDAHGGTAIDARHPADADPNAPDADPSAPDADPSEPDADPGTPDAKPDQPDAKPSTCAGSPPYEPFGSHHHPYAAGVIQPTNASQGEMDDATAAYYDKWKSRYLRQACGAGRYYVGYNGPNQTVSEAHGYGMLISVLMAGHDPQAKTIFDGEFAYYNDHRSTNQKDMMAWKQVNCNDSDGSDSATDGDLDIAYALLLADKQWGSSGSIDYLAEAKRMIGGLMEGEVDGGHHYLLLGDWAAAGDPQYDATRGSDFMPEHLASFAAATGGNWKTVLDGEYATFAAVQQGISPSTGLVPDFMLHPHGNVVAAGANFLEGAHDGDYSYNSCRVPWRLATHFVVSGDARSKALSQKLNGWIKSSTGNDPGGIMAGYKMNGTAFANYNDMAFTAPFGVAAMVDGSNQAWLNSLWDAIQDDSDPGYFGDSIKLISMIVISGNYWVPEASSCQ
jgi:endo-1,4-beta-D-glucanase Y